MQQAAYAMPPPTATTAEDNNRRRIRALQRAYRALARMHPEDFAELHAAERQAEGLAARRRVVIDPERFTRMWVCGATLQELADAFDCHVNTIQRHARQLGLRRYQPRGQQ